MKTETPFKVYARVMSSLELNGTATQQIIRNCARRSTLEKMKSGKYKLVAVKKEKIEKF